MSSCTAALCCDLLVRVSPVEYSKVPPYRTRRLYNFSAIASVDAAFCVLCFFLNGIHVHVNVQLSDFLRPTTFGLAVSAIRQGFTPAMLEAYNLYRLSLLKSLKSWDLFHRPESLVAVALDIKQLRR